MPKTHPLEQSEERLTPASCCRREPWAGVGAPTLALLAGGMATRMRPATNTTAKSMLQVAGMPFIGHQLRMLVDQGIAHVVICCGHLEDQIRDFVGDGTAFGCRVDYSPDGAQPLGTGGALRKALPLLGEQFLVMYGDSFLPAPLAPVWESLLASAKPALMTVYRNRDQWDRSNVEFVDGAILDYSKTVHTDRMQYIDYGLSCLRAGALTAWPEGSRFDLAEVMGLLVEQQQLAGYQVHERFYEIGSPAGLAETDALLRAGHTASARQQPEEAGYAR